MLRILTATALALGLAAPASAQGPICGGISLVGEWVGAEEAASDVTTADAPFEMEGTVPIAGHLVRMFDLSDTTDLRIDVAAVPAGDPYIAVFDASGEEVAADDDSAGNFASRVQTTLDAGTYCLAARSYESGPTKVAVKIGRPEQDFGEEIAVTPDAAATPPVSGPGCFQPDTPRLAADVTPEILSGSPTTSGTAGTTPAFGFSLAEPTSLSVTARSDSGDTLIRLLDEDGTVLGENDDFDGLDSRIDVTETLDAGAYCIELEDLNGLDNSIDVALQAFDPAADRLRRLNAAEFAPNRSDTLEVTDLGPIGSGLLREVTASADAEWFSFTLPESGLLVAEAIGEGSDPSLVLFDRLGRRVAENDDGPEGLDSFLVARLFAGSYTLALRLVDEGRPGTVRLLMERYVPAE